MDSRVVLDAEGAEELTPPGDALVLMGHRIVRISISYFKAPVPSEDIGSDDDLRLVGLSPDARAVFVAIEGGCKPTREAIKSNFHWGTERARRALKQLRVVGLLETSAEDEEASDDEENAGAAGAAGGAAAAGAACPDCPDCPSTTINEPRSSFLDIEGTEISSTPAAAAAAKTKEVDAQAVIEAIKSGACKDTGRAVETHFHWGTRRASAALRAAREVLSQ